MIPSFVRFHNLTIDPRKLILNNVSRKRTRGPADPDWVRVTVEAPNTSANRLEQVDKWISENTNGKWTSYEIGNESKVVIFFEEESEAILFKLCNGNGEALATELN